MTDTEKRTEHPEDTGSDPAEADGSTPTDDGADWSDEGGATSEGPATDTDD